MLDSTSAGEGNYEEDARDGGEEVEDRLWQSRTANIHTNLVLVFSFLFFFLSQAETNEFLRETSS